MKDRPLIMFVYMAIAFPFIVLLAPIVVLGKFSDKMLDNLYKFANDKEKQHE